MLIIDKYDNQGFLPVTVLYGPNGGGKTGVIESLYYLFALITNYIYITKLPNDKANQLINRVSIANKYHKFDEGTVGLIVNGDGLALAARDYLEKLGQKTACYLDIKGGVDEDKILLVTTKNKKKSTSKIKIKNK